jgi:hypothetical protein
LTRKLDRRELDSDITDLFAVKDTLGLVLGLSLRLNFFEGFFGFDLFFATTEHLGEKLVVDL